MTEWKDLDLPARIESVVAKSFTTVDALCSSTCDKVVRQAGLGNGSLWRIRRALEKIGREMNCGCPAMTCLRRAGRVYFILSHDDSMMKIGKTFNDRRFADICNMNAHPLRLAAEVAGYSSVERWFHLKLAHLRHHGEWFRFGPEASNLLDSVSKAGMMAAAFMCPAALAEDAQANH